MHDEENFLIFQLKIEKALEEQGYKKTLNFSEHIKTFSTMK